jgi:UDPglucose--hexose-1-phosphate uridylyltransferase
MSELRRDPVMGRWVIIAPERALRPDAMLTQRDERLAGPCVFCGGQEDRDPSEITAIRAAGTAANSPGWRVRVLPNKFPVLRIEGKLVREGVGMFDMMSGIGAHEVIIETPDHDLELADLPEAHIADVVAIYRDRMADLGGDDRFKYVLIFKNQGHEAGATLDHAHSQLIATPVTPKRVKEELVGAQRYYEFKRRCVFCDIIRQETRLTTERLVLENDGFVVISPFAARVPYEMWIVPKQHNCDFAAISDSERLDLARILKQTLLRLRAALDDPPFNYLIHTAPFRRPRAGYWVSIQHDYHWHLELIPRLTRPAGFEEGSGFFINPVAPESAATALLNASARERPEPPAETPAGSAKTQKAP